VRRRAVIFDDDYLIRFALWELFDGRGYEVFTFSEPGLCPLHVVLKCPCPTGTSCADLILSDVNMHAANGIDYIEQLIQKGCRQGHFALMSGHFSEDDVTRASGLGCKLFTKPLDMHEVKNWIDMFSDPWDFA
jgi:DNA-binding response OmpR family regulator